MEYGPAPESADIVQAWLDKHKDGFGLYINGRMQPPGKDLLEVTNPATGKVIAKVTRATTDGRRRGGQGGARRLSEVVGAARP